MDATRAHALATAPENDTAPEGRTRTHQGRALIGEPGLFHRDDIFRPCGAVRGGAGNIPAKCTRFYINELCMIILLCKANLAGNFPAVVKC